VVVDDAGRFYTGVDDGRIIRLNADGGEPTVIANTGGRPLGLAVPATADCSCATAPVACWRSIPIPARSYRWSGPSGVGVAMVWPPNAAAEGLAPRAPVLRKLLWLLPDRFAPQLTPEVWAVEFDSDTGAVVAGTGPRIPGRHRDVIAEIDVWPSTSRTLAPICSFGR
jgi:hypothetical protein